jgi:hypothetical protein
MRGLLVLFLGGLAFMVSLALVQVAFPREEAAAAGLPAEWAAAEDNLLHLSSLAIQACTARDASQVTVQAAYAETARRYGREIHRLVLAGATRPDVLPATAPALDVMMARVCRLAREEPEPEPEPVMALEAGGAGPTRITFEFANGLAAKFAVDNSDGWLTAFLARWARYENTSARHNPLATTQGYPGATNFNRVGVKNYLTVDDGVAATYKTITNGLYPSVVAHIRSRGATPLNPAEMRTWGTIGFARELTR